MFLSGIVNNFCTDAVLISRFLECTCFGPCRAWCVVIFLCVFTSADEVVSVDVCDLCPALMGVASRDPCAHVGC